LKEHQQLQRRSSEKPEQSGTNTFRSTKAARPEEASAIASSTDDLELQPTEGEQNHLHPNRQKGEEDGPHITGTKDVAILGIAMEETKDYLQIVAKLSGETHAARDEDEANEPLLTDEDIIKRKISTAASERLLFSGVLKSSQEEEEQKLQLAPTQRRG
jgi:hypothetical protein